MVIAELINALPGAVAQGMIYGIMSIGVYITFKIMDISDLTVDGCMATGGAVCISMMLGGTNVYVAMLCAVIAGMLAGLMTGIFHTFMGIPAILAGILTQFSLYSINLAIQGFKANQGISVNKYHLFVSARNVKALDFSNPIFITAIVLVFLILFLYWFFNTETGCALRATGSNIPMSRALGINTDTCKIIGLMLGNGIVSLASAMFAQFQGSVDVNMGRGAIVIGLAAVIIGEVLFGKLFKNFALKLVAVVIGSVIYYIIIQIVLWLGLNTNLLKMFQALIVAVFLAIPFWKSRFHIGRKGASGNA